MNDASHGPDEHPELGYGDAGARPDTNGPDVDDTAMQPPLPLDRGEAEKAGRPPHGADDGKST